MRGSRLLYLSCLVKQDGGGNSLHYAILPSKGVGKLSRANVVTIEHLEVKKSDIEKVKKAFRVKDNAEAMKRALAVATGKVELEGIFERHRGVKIKKVYA